MSAEVLVLGARANRSVTTSSASVTLPVGATALLVQSTGGDSYFRTGTGAQTAVTTDQLVMNGYPLLIRISGAHDTLAAITATGTATLQVTSVGFEDV